MKSGGVALIRPSWHAGGGAVTGNLGPERGRSAEDLALEVSMLDRQAMKVGEALPSKK
jgi:hypothetical protein